MDLVQWISCPVSLSPPGGCSRTWPAAVPVCQRGFQRVLFDRCSSVTSRLLWFHFFEWIDKFQRKKTGEKRRNLKKKKYQLDWLPFWSSQGLGPRNPIWEGRREEERKKEREEKKGKGEIRRREKKSYHSVSKCAAGDSTRMHSFDKNVWLSAHPCSPLNATRVLLSMPAARSWLHYAEYVEA